MRIRRSVKTKLLIFMDNFNVFIGLRHPLIPPKRYDNINIGSSEIIGKEFLNYFIKYGDLEPTSKVLEVGSGFGRMAIPLTSFLSKEGHYYGIEIIRDGVNWCTAEFTSRFPNFKFEHIDVYNERYNPKGNYKASEFVFPFPDASYDLVYLTSVFTHMFASDVENYLSEISRVLKPGGKCIITYFIINDIATEHIFKNKSSFSFKNRNKENYIEDLSNPEYAIAFNEDYIKNLYDKNSISLIQPIFYGKWSGRSDFLSFQDLIVGKKKLNINEKNIKKSIGRKAKTNDWVS